MPGAPRDVNSAGGWVSLLIHILQWGGDAPGYTDGDAGLTIWVPASCPLPKIPAPPGPGSTAGVGAMLHIVRGDPGPSHSSFLPFLEISWKQQLLDSLEMFHPLIPSGSPLRVPRVNPKITSLETLALGGSPGGSKISRKRFANKRFIGGASETKPILFQLFYQESLSPRDQLDETQSLHSNFSLSFCVSLFPSVCVGSVHETAWEEMLDMFKLSRNKKILFPTETLQREKESSY